MKFFHKSIPKSISAASRTESAAIPGVKHITEIQLCQLFMIDEKVSDAGISPHYIIDFIAPIRVNLEQQRIIGACPRHAGHIV